MKSYSKSFLPDSIEYKGQTFKYNSEATERHRTGVTLVSRYHVLVKVLGRNLKGKTDLHGKPYKPNEYVFSSPIGFLPMVEKAVQSKSYIKALKSIQTFGY